ncbi:MAG: tRNA pseudouridine(55) synthase TruB [Treponema sp.]|nr:tRNA pseudouridine(55) synthase TruB [Treponema sp.]
MIDCSGYMLLSKKEEQTSFQALEKVKERFATTKVGHTGTLDKFATGLLVVLVGKALRLAQWFTNKDKKYEATIRFGIETDTLDPYGKVLYESEPPTEESLRACMAQFRGSLVQIPPEYSAIHINGKRASDYARSGTPVIPPARPVTIYSLALISYKPPVAQLAIHCSKGTYIRSLARDIAHAVHSCAHLSALNRTAIAGFSLSEAHENLLKPIDADLFHALDIPVQYVNTEQHIHTVLHGKKIDFLAPPDGKPLALFRNDGTFLAIVEPDNTKQWRYGYVYAHS